MKKKSNVKVPADLSEGAGSSIKAAVPGRPFKKGQSGNPSGRVAKSTNWKAAEDELREALPRILRMRKSDLAKLISDNPTGVEMLAAKYIHEHTTEAVSRFLGAIPKVLTGEGGDPLIPPVPPESQAIKNLTTEQLLALIEATK